MAPPNAEWEQLGVLPRWPACLDFWDVTMGWDGISPWDGTSIDDKSMEPPKDPCMVNQQMVNLW